tara:strand:- start:3385 stop:3876 length:492 start_codon:yes stop_codon:yes gene_type:complete
MNIKTILKHKLKNGQNDSNWDLSINNAFKVLNPNYISNNEILLFALNAKKIEHFDNIVSLLYSDSRLPNSGFRTYKKIFKYSKGESIEGRSKKHPIKEYDLSDWIESLYITSKWLETKGLNTSFDAQIEYIGCTAEVNVDGGLASLPNMVIDFLELYGFEKVL